MEEAAKHFQMKSASTYRRRELEGRLEARYCAPIEHLLDAPVPAPNVWAPGQIKHLVDSPGLTLEKVAQICEVTPRTLERWINGTRKPSFLRRQYLDYILKAQTDLEK